MAFITGTTNKSVSSTGPEVYLPRVAKEVLETQCIPEDPSLWQVKKAEEFWAARREKLSEAFNEFLKINLAKRRAVA